MKPEINNTVLTQSDIAYLKAMKKMLYEGGCGIGEYNIGRSMSLPVDIFYKLVSNLKEEIKAQMI